MSTSADTDVARHLVMHFYDCAARGRITDFRDCLADTFILFVPPQLPWGGTFDKAEYVALLPTVATVLDFRRLTFLSVTAEHDHVVALIDIGIAGTPRSTIISEHWDVHDGKATQLRVAYFDPTALLESARAAAASAGSATDTRLPA